MRLVYLSALMHVYLNIRVAQILKVGLLWVHLKLYIHLKISFTIQLHQLQYLIVYICFLNSPCSYRMVSRLHWKLDCNLVLDKNLGL